MSVLVRQSARHIVGAEWEQYEREKQKLRELELEPAEYERRLSEVADRLGV